MSDPEPAEEDVTKPPSGNELSQSPESPPPGDPVGTTAGGPTSAAADTAPDGGDEPPPPPEGSSALDAGLSDGETSAPVPGDREPEAVTAEGEGTDAAAVGGDTGGMQPPRTDAALTADPETPEPSAVTSLAEAGEVAEVVAAALEMADDGELGPLNPDGLVATPSTSLHPLASETLRPAAPPPSQQQFELSQQGPNSGDRLYWEEQLAALSEDQDSDDMPVLPGEEPRGTTPQPPEEPPVEVAPPAPPGRRGVSPYPLYEPPEGAVTDDGSELTGRFSYADMTPRSVPYPLYRTPSLGGDALPDEATGK